MEEREEVDRCPPGRVRDAIFHVLRGGGAAADKGDCRAGLRPDRPHAALLGPLVSATEHADPFCRVGSEEVIRCVAMPRRAAFADEPTGEVPAAAAEDVFSLGRARLHFADCFDWLRRQADCSIHAVVTDPPYGLHEYTDRQQAKLRSGKGGVWRIPPSFDGHLRSPLPRFTTLTVDQLSALRDFFFAWGSLLLPKLAPGANVVVASNPLLSYIRGGRPCRRRLGTPRRTDSAGHDDARRRPAQGGPPGVFRSQRHASFDVGAVAGLSAADRGPRAGQSSEMEDGRVPPPRRRQAFRRRDSFGADAKEGAGAGTPP